MNWRFGLENFLSKLSDIIAQTLKHCLEGTQISPKLMTHVPFMIFLFYTSFIHLSLLIFIFAMLCSFLGLDQGLNPGPQQWVPSPNHGPPGNSQCALQKKRKIWRCFVACEILVPWLTLVAWNPNHDHREFPQLFLLKPEKTSQVIYFNTHVINKKRNAQRNGENHPLLLSIWWWSQSSCQPLVQPLGGFLEQSWSWPAHPRGFLISALWVSGGASLEIFWSVNLPSSWHSSPSSLCSFTHLSCDKPPSKKKKRTSSFSI